MLLHKQYQNDSVKHKLIGFLNDNIYPKWKGLFWASGFSLTSVKPKAFWFIIFF